MALSETHILFLYLLLTSNEQIIIGKVELTRHHRW